MDFLDALKTWFFDNAKRSNNAYWTLKREHGSKWKLVSVNNETSDSDSSWEMLRGQVVSLVKDGGVKSMEVVFRASTNDEGKSYPIKVSEFAKSASIGGIGGSGIDPWALLIQQMQSNQEARIAAIRTENEVLRKLERLEDERNRTKDSTERFVEAMNGLLEKPNVTALLEKIVDRVFPDVPAIAGAAAADREPTEPKAAKSTQDGDGIDFNGAIKGAMSGYAAAGYDIDWNKPVDAVLLLREAGIRDPEVKVLRFAEFLSKNPAMAEQLEAMAAAQMS